jgi:hypothetical protein
VGEDIAESCDLFPVGIWVPPHEIRG